MKEAVFPFARFPSVDTILGPEMKSTGEVMGLDANFERAFAKSQLGGGVDAAATGTVFLSVRDATRAAWSRPAGGWSRWASSSWRPAAPPALREAGLAVEVVNKVLEGRPHCVDACGPARCSWWSTPPRARTSIADSFASAAPR